jgi:hypothetical protein
LCDNLHVGWSSLAVTNILLSSSSSVSEIPHSQVHASIDIRR